jgi:predicted Ser/Thr protein kinase
MIVCEKAMAIDSERLRQIEELYHMAGERTPGEREAFLKDVCANDAELLRAVLALLAQDSGAGPMQRPVIELAASLLNDTRWTAGTKVGPYQIVGRLGQGGMGEVFQARDTRLGRNVAVKIAHAEFTGGFQREALAISALNHPHICTLYDVGSNYLVMELVEGETLARHLDKGRLPMDLVLRYGAQLADALSAAHAKSITHRDLKPGNIVVARTGVKVLDFGLAQFARNPELAAHLVETASTSRSIIGTPAYMAPEQLQGKECDARTDIFALGLVLYQMATGRKAFTADSQAELIVEIMRSQPDLSGLAPPSFAHIVERCLAKRSGGSVADRPRRQARTGVRGPHIAGAALCSRTQAPLVAGGGGTFGSACCSSGTWRPVLQKRPSGLFGCSADQLPGSRDAPIAFSRWHSSGLHLGRRTRRQLRRLRETDRSWQRAAVDNEPSGRGDVSLVSGREVDRVPKARRR